MNAEEEKIHAGQLPPLQDEFEDEEKVETKIPGKKKSLPVKKNRDESVKSDYYWVYRKMGGRDALLKWAQNPKSMNDEFFKQFKTIVGGQGGKGGKSEKVVFVNDVED